MRLSILIPAYNESCTLELLIAEVLQADVSGLEREIVLVDDGSTDGTAELAAQYEGREGFRVARHDRNFGKGRAVRTGLELATGDFILIQDADLEYDPGDYPALLAPMLAGKADVVYGSRFKGSGRAFLATHYYGNKFITFVANVLYNTCLTDLETCYKLFRREVFDKIRLRCNSFDIEAEITAKIFKHKFRVHEVPISYSGRDFNEGKKITWRDGLIALWTLLRFRFTD